MKYYTEIFEGFQIRDVLNLNGDKIDPYVFDVVKWEKDNSVCYSVAHLEYDKKEVDFELKSIGLKWLESHPSKAVENWVILWCRYKAYEIGYNF